MKSFPWLFLRNISVAIVLALIFLTFAFPVITPLLIVILIPLAPMTVVLLGYHRWREICPLSFFSKLGQGIKRDKRPKIWGWFDQNYFYVQLPLFLCVISGEIIFKHFNPNINNYLFPIGLTLTLAFVFFLGFYFRGKTWCNFICPMGLVEKFYCGSTNTHSQENSECKECTACKKNCPDIDFENNYWKEKSMGSKVFAYYAFPGIVLGYYAYHFLEGNPVTAVFIEEIAQNPQAEHNLFSAGFYFLPSIPKLVAAPLTLMAFALFSFILFSTLESHFSGSKARDEEGFDARHLSMLIASFVSFNTFYILAMGPQLGAYPFLASVLKYSGVAISTVIILKGLNRKEKDFIQERFAKNFLRRWKWSDKPPEDMKEIYSVYKERENTYKQVLNSYKEVIQDLVQDGILTHDGLNLLKKVREQMGISESDHEKVISTLSMENKRLFDTDYIHSVENALQLKNYRNILEEHILSGTGNETVFRQMMARYGVSEEDHNYILREVTDKDGLLWSQVREGIEKARQTGVWVEKIPLGRHISTDYLSFILSEELINKLEEVLTPLSLIKGESFINNLKNRILDRDFGDVEDVARELKDSGDETLVSNFIFVLKALDENKPCNIAASMADLLVEIIEASGGNLLATAIYSSIHTGGEKLKEHISRALQNQDPMVRQVAASALKQLDLLDEDSLEGLKRDQSRLVSEWAQKGLDSTSGAPNLSLVEHMALIHQVPLFARLNSKELERLAKETREKVFPEGAKLCSQGEFGEEVFIIIRGKARVYITKGGKDRLANEAPQGSCIGEIAVLGEVPRTGTVIASDGPVYALVLNAFSFRYVITQDPSISLQVMKEMSNRLLRG